VKEMLAIASGPHDLELFYRIEELAYGTQGVRRIIGDQDPDTAIAAFHCTPLRNKKSSIPVEEFA